MTAAGISIVVPRPSPTSPAEAVAFFEAHRLPITPVKPGEKAGRLPRWSQPGHSANASDFRLGESVGVLNGTQPIEGLFFHDVDIDAKSDAARLVVKRLLPQTGWRYGRPGNPESHYNYLVKAAALRTRRYFGIDGKSIIELRGITQKKTHTLSVAPGSTHPSGEAIRFCEPRTAPGRVEVAEDLDKAVQHAAVGIVILQIWPTSNRHRCRLAAAKVLLDYGMPEDCVRAILEAVMEATGSDVDDVSSAVRNTDEAIHAGHATAGASVLGDVLGEETAKAMLTAIARVLRSAPADDGKSIVVNEPTTPMIDRAWARLAEANEPPGLFRRQNEVVILHNSANTCIEQLYTEQLKLAEPSALQRISGFRPITLETFREVLARMVPCVLVTKDSKRTHVYPSPEFGKLMLASPALPLPEPQGFTTVPFFTKDGTLVTTPGLHRPTGMFYQPPADFTLPPVPDHPSEIDKARAIGVIDAMVWQFPFKGRRGLHPYEDVREDCDWRETTAYSNMLAFALTVLTRSLFHAVPLFLFDKPTTRTGASLLVQCWCYILTGAWPSEAEWDGSESERRKFLTAILMTGTPIIFLDEVKDLKSPDLNKILTGKAARIGRILGTSDITSPQNFATFVATGNNPVFPKDMAGRMCRVRLDADMHTPSSRVGWDKNLMSWVPEHRAELLMALYVLIRAWFADGSPPPNKDRVLNGFEPWSYTIGGILQHAGLPGFLANKKDVEDDADDDEEGNDMDGFLVEWKTKHIDVVTTPTLLMLPGLPSVEGVLWTAKQLGAWLRQNRDRRLKLSDESEIRIVKVGDSGRWRLKVLSDLMGQAARAEQDTEL